MKQWTNIFQQVEKEMKAQRIQWGEQNHPCLDQVLLERKGACTQQRMCEEYEIPTESRAKQLLESRLRNGALTYAHIALEEFSEVVSSFDPIQRRAELLQLAAVVCSWIEKIDRDMGVTIEAHTMYEDYKTVYEILKSKGVDSYQSVAICKKLDDKTKAFEYLTTGLDLFQRLQFLKDHYSQAELINILGMEVQVYVYLIMDEVIRVK